VASDLVSAIVPSLAAIHGVRAIALGGSYARGTQLPDSDIDLGLYYGEKSPFSVDALQRLAEEINDEPGPVVTGFGRWGRWVNGGAWLVVKGQRLDLLYRSIDALERTIEECRQGRFESDYYREMRLGFACLCLCWRGRRARDIIEWRSTRNSSTRMSHLCSLTD